MAEDTTPIVTATQLGNHLHQSLDEPTAWQAIRFAEGQLFAATHIRPWPPVPCPEDIWSWTLELAGYAYSNPQDRESKSSGAVAESWSRRIDRKAQILATAEKYYAGGGSPAGVFPYSTPYPDPAERYGYPSWVPWLRAPGFAGVVPDDTAPAP